ncbi:MAG: hypothetical protein ABIN67_05360 [Ferruginibacter sp.]
MQFEEIINAKLTNEADRPLMQKEAFPVSPALQHYLQNNGRDIVLPISYTDLLYYSHANALRDKAGKLTHWENAVYDVKVQARLNGLLLKTYSILKRQTDTDFMKESTVRGIDFCEFGNSVPFRIAIVNKDKGQQDYFYIKLADASRIYGLELEQLLSPDSTNFLYHNNTLVEEHIEGIPGDVYIKQFKELDAGTASLFAKEFVQFNERCFARLLGDMRSYNFVVNHHLNIFRIRAIDFDQQSYEGKKTLYLPQFYKENFGFVELVLKMLNTDDILQYQAEERNNMKGRVALNKKRLMDLLNAMVKDELSENYKILLLRKELNEHFSTTAFSACKTMGAIVKKQLKQVLSKSTIY